MSFVTFTTGQIFPVREICRMARARGIETIVDGAHAYAQFPFQGSELECDYFGAAGHKWLLAPVGTGFLYVRRDKIAKVWPLFASAAKPDDIRKFEAIGTSPVAHRNAISEALSFHESIGVERKAARFRYLRDRWMTRLANAKGVTMRNSREPAQSCGIAALSLAGWDAGELTKFLMEKHSVHVRPRWVAGDFPFHCVRVSPNVYTTLEEIDLFCNGVEAASVMRKA